MVALKEKEHLLERNFKPVQLMNVFKHDLIFNSSVITIQVLPSEENFNSKLQTKHTVLCNDSDLEKRGK